MQIPITEYQSISTTSVLKYWNGLIVRCYVLFSFDVKKLRLYIASSVCLSSGCAYGYSCEELLRLDSFIFYLTILQKISLQQKRYVFQLLQKITCPKKKSKTFEWTSNWQGEILSRCKTLNKSLLSKCKVYSQNWKLPDNWFELIHVSCIRIQQAKFSSTT